MYYEEDGFYQVDTRHTFPAREAATLGVATGAPFAKRGRFRVIAQFTPTKNQKWGNQRRYLLYWAVQGGPLHFLREAEETSLMQRSEFPVLNLYF